VDCVPQFIAPEMRIGLHLQIHNESFRGSKTLAGVFTLMIPEIASQMVKISSTMKTCDMSDIRLYPWLLVSANCVGPGRIDVERDAYQKKKDFYKHQLIRRSGTPDEVASLVVYLASEKAGYITGQCYLVNGGAYLQ